MLLAAILALAAVSAQEQNASFGQRLILNVYLDNSGKALVTGYAENISGLAFINTSQYRYENETNQLYALTDGLTTKTKDQWTLGFNAGGRFDDYRVTFYLPSDMRLGKINVTSGLGYQLSASNESLVADVQGYEVTDPNISIEYQQSLAASSGTPPLPLPPGSPAENTTLILLLVVLVVLSAALAATVLARRHSGGYQERAPASGTMQGGSGAAAEPDSDDSRALPSFQEAANQQKSLSLAPDSLDDGVYFTGNSLSPDSTADEPSGEPRAPLSDNHAGGEGVPAEVAAPASEELAQIPIAPVAAAAKGSIVVSSEMAAVMQTLTARERSVLTTLIDHGGRMTQADIRYETGTPKSSLTGILISLERRKLVTKKEWGRTNIIELSEWFLSKKERS